MFSFLEKYISDLNCCINEDRKKKVIEPKKTDNIQQVPNVKLKIKKI